MILNNMIKFFSFLFFFLTITNFFADAQLSQSKKDTLDLRRQYNINTDECKANISIENTELVFNKKDEKFVHVILKNLGETEFSIPEWLIQGENNDSSAETVLEVEKWNDEQKIFSPIVSDEIFDYNYETSGRISNLIFPNEEKVYQEKIDLLIRINESGKYRFKLKLRKICQLKEIELDWKEFKVN